MDKPPAQIMPTYPHSTNSTMFTECCEVAICDDQPNCPRCNRPVIGYDLTPNARGRIRWNSSKRYWEKKVWKR